VIKENLLQEVRGACRRVAERAVFVAIDHGRLPGYAASLPVARALRPEIDPERHHLGHGADTVAFFLTLDTINFGSGYFQELSLRPGQSGYFMVAGALTVGTGVRLPRLELGSGFQDWKFEKPSTWQLGSLTPVLQFYNLATWKPDPSFMTPVLQFYAVSFLPCLPHYLPQKMSVGCIPAISEIDLCI
jgi:hypothetical protein